MNLNVNYGTVQGRLTKFINSGLQQFPFDSYSDEFRLARELGLRFVEPFFDELDNQENPLLRAETTARYMQSAQDNLIIVDTVCFDTIISRGLIDQKNVIANRLKHLVGYGITQVILPMMGKSLLTEKSMAEFGNIIQHLRDCGVKVILESLLPTEMLIGYVNTLNHENIGILYDTGNVAPFGYSAARDIKMLDDCGLLSHIHIKDKSTNHSNVLLGSGLVDFESVVRTLKDINYSGPLVFESVRTSNPKENMERNLTYINSLY